MFENVRELSRHISKKKESLVLRIPDIEISRNYTINTKNTTVSIGPENQRALKMCKSTLWYRQKKIKESKTIKIYNKTKVKIE